MSTSSLDGRHPNGTAPAIEVLIRRDFAQFRSDTRLSRISRMVAPEIMEGDISMRIVDDRYSNDRARLELALRFLRHEARTQTIRAWTGLSGDRIRKLHRTYLSRIPMWVPRHRGKSPHQVSYFTRSPRLKEETAVLASLLTLTGVMQSQAAQAGSSAGTVSAPACTDQGETVYGVARGVLLCQAFEAYRALIPSAQISFEHAVFLTAALSRGDQLRLDTCKECGGLVVVDRFPLRDPRCRHCNHAAPAK
jgi:hypothetical protein